MFLFIGARNKIFSSGSLLCFEKPHSCSIRSFSQYVLKLNISSSFFMTNSKMLHAHLLYDSKLLSNTAVFYLCYQKPNISAFVSLPLGFSMLSACYIQLLFSLGFVMLSFCFSEPCLLLILMKLNMQRNVVKKNYMCAYLGIISKQCDSP